MRPLSDEATADALNKFYGRKIYTERSIMPSDRAIAQEAHDNCLRQVVEILIEHRKHCLKAEGDYITALIQGLKEEVSK